MPRIINSRLAYDGYAKVTVLTLAADDGAQFNREVVSIGQSACVLPYDPDRKVALLVSLPRAPLIADAIADELLEAPAGMLAPDETAEASIRREAMEEAGVRLGELTSALVAAIAGGRRTGKRLSISREEEALTEHWPPPRAALHDPTTGRAGWNCIRAVAGSAEFGEIGTHPATIGPSPDYQTVVTRDGC